MAPSPTPDKPAYRRLTHYLLPGLFTQTVTSYLLRSSLGLRSLQKAGGCPYWENETRLIFAQFILSSEGGRQ